jgi:TPR repeat protein
VLGIGTTKKGKGIEKNSMSIPPPFDPFDPPWPPADSPVPLPGSTAAAQAQELEICAICLDTVPRYFSDGKSHVHRSTCCGKTIHSKCFEQLTRQWTNANGCHMCRAPFPTSPEEAYARLLPWARKNTAWAISLMGSSHELGHGVPVSKYIARLCYEKGASLGDGQCSWNLSLKHYKGEGGLPVSLKKARFWVKIAADQGIPVASARLAEMHRDGEGGPVSLLKARILFEKAAEQEFPEAYAHLAEMHLSGNGGPESLRKARILFEKAAEHGIVRAMVALGEMLNRGEGGPVSAEKARPWFEKAADQGEKGAQFFLGKMHYFGRGGLPVSKEKARFWYQKAAEQDLHEAQYLLAIMHRTGVGGLSASWERALFWYEKSAEGGNRDAQCNLGLFHDKGLGGFPASKYAAKPWYEKAAEQEDRMALYRLGLLHLNGEAGLPVSFEKAAALFSRAAKLGHLASAGCVRALKADHGVEIPCFNCGAVGDGHRRCSGCQGAWYCSKKCQTAEWKTGDHKHICKKIRHEHFDYSDMGMSAVSGAEAVAVAAATAAAVAGAAGSPNAADVNTNQDEVYWLTVLNAMVIELRNITTIFNVATETGPHAGLFISALQDNRSFNILGNILGGPRGHEFSDQLADTAACLAAGDDWRGTPGAAVLTDLVLACDDAFIQSPFHAFIVEEEKGEEKPLRPLRPHEMESGIRGGVGALEQLGLDMVAMRKGKYRWSARRLDPELIPALIINVLQEAKGSFLASFDLVSAVADDEDLERDTQISEESKRVVKMVPKILAIDWRECLLRAEEHYEREENTQQMVEQRMALFETLRS